MTECETAARALGLKDFTAVDDGYTSGTSGDPRTATTGLLQVSITLSSTQVEETLDLAKLSTNANASHYTFLHFAWLNIAHPFKIYKKSIFGRVKKPKKIPEVHTWDRGCGIL